MRSSETKKIAILEKLFDFRPDKISYNMLSCMLGSNTHLVKNDCERNESTDEDLFICDLETGWLSTER